MTEKIGVISEWLKNWLQTQSATRKNIYDVTTNANKLVNSLTKNISQSYKTFCDY